MNNCFDYIFYCMDFIIDFFAGGISGVVAKTVTAPV